MKTITRKQAEKLILEKLIAEAKNGFKHGSDEYIKLLMKDLGIDYKLEGEFNYE